MEKKGKLFQWKLIPYDLSHFVGNLTAIAFRMKRLHVSGERYRGRIRGGAIFAMNHVGFSDPFVVSVCFWYRRVFYLAAEAVMKGKLRSLLLRGTGCIKIDRNISDLEAVKKCIGILKEGRTLAVFPQGSVTGEEEAVQIKSGAILMALQAGVPIIPMYSPRREHWYQRKVVVIGDAIDCGEFVTKKIPSMKNIEAASHALQQAMQSCREVCERRKKHDDTTAVAPGL